MRGHLFLLLATGCAPSEEAVAPLRLATQNAGTTPYLDLIAPSELREVCEGWYDNNLCTLDAEAALARALAEEQPDVLFLQEVWHQPLCSDDERPAEVNREPFSCAGEGDQLSRVLPTRYDRACSVGYPDSCIAWGAAFEPESSQPRLDDIDAGCGAPGRLATLQGTLSGQPALLVVIHATAGFSADDVACRVVQLDALAGVLLSLPEETLLVVAGDINHDPEGGREDAAALAALFDAAGLQRLPDDGYTAHLLAQDLDIIATRGISEDAQCTVRLVDEDLDVPMFDHGLLSCGP